MQSQSYRDLVVWQKSANCLMLSLHRLKQRSQN
jgi:hypothetical protein